MSETPEFDPVTMRAHMDAFVNAITGVGGQFTDKTRGGLAGGPQWQLNPVLYPEANNLYRGSDLGRTIVDKPVEEMTRRGWDVEVQPGSDEPARLDACMREPARAAAGWRRIARRLDGASRSNAMEHAARWDADPATATPPPGALPDVDNSGVELGDAIEKWAERLPTNCCARGATAAISQALRYERAFGGGCVFIGVEEDNPGAELIADNGLRLDARDPRNLTAPLDLARVRKVTHLTALRGGVDGVVTMWRPYRFAIRPKFGMPEIYQVTNSSVPIAATPAPGELLPPEVYPSSPSGPTLFYVHESRFLVFDGEPTSIETRQELRGWGDSIFTRVKDPLLTFEQGWGAVSILLQEASIASVGIEGFTKALAEKGVAARDAFVMYAQLQSLMRSVARTNFYDSANEFKRDAVSFAGISDVLDRQVDRIAAASGMPVSVLFGNLQGGLGAKEDPSSRGWYATIGAKQESRLRDPLEYLYRVGWRSKAGPTRGVEPDNWTVLFRPLWQLTELESAKLRLDTSTADGMDITNQIVTPSEVTATRYGGPEYNPGPIVIDVDAREKASAMREAPTPPGPSTDPTEATPDAPAVPAATPLPDGPGYTSPIPPIRMMPTDPWTGTPTGSPSGAGETLQVPEGTPGRG